MSKLTYTIAGDGKSITCLICHMTSYHPQDVEQRFCGKCHLFHESPEIPVQKKEGQTVFDMSKHKGWGNSIYWNDYEQRSLTGHLTPRPDVGDLVKSEMKSDIDGLRQWRLFEIIKMDKMSDPPDMFFADCRDVGLITIKGDVQVVLREGEKCPFCKKKVKEFFQGLDHLNHKHMDVFKERLEI